MPTVMILGPSIEVSEPSLGIAPEGFAGIEFNDPPTLPGGRVRFVVLREPEGEPKLRRPVNVYAFFVPSDQKPDRLLATPDTFFSGRHANGSVGIVPDRNEYEVKAAGVQPGAYFVQTILEYHTD